MTIVNRPVRLMEIAGAGEQVAELGALKAVLWPVDFLLRATPRLLLEQGADALGEFAIEAGIMRDDDDSAFHEGCDRIGIDAMSGHHLVGDPRECDDLWR